MVESPIRPSGRGRRILAWLARKSYTKVNPVLLAAASVAAIVVTSIIFQINRIAYRRIDDLEED